MILVNEPLLNGNEKKYLNECIDTGWVSSEGPFVKQFEDAFAEYIGVKHGVAVANGTASLETALYAAGIGEGDEVIMPAFTIISCALACLRLGIKPVLVDIEPETWNMDTNLIEAKITDKTKAVMPVHIYGHPVDMDPVIALAEKYNLKIIEDAAEVHGAEYKGRKCGSMSTASSFSFYANKLVTTGEGGMVLTDDDEVAERARNYRNLCFKPAERFVHDELGYNFRMTNLQAAVGLAQVERLEQIVEFKRSMGKYYEEKLSEIKGIRFQSEKPWAKTVYWMYSIELDESLGMDAKDVMEELKKYKIGTRPFFRGLHEQKALNDRGLFIGESYPVTEHAFKYGFYLPSGMTLTKEQVDTVCETLKNILNG